MVVSKKSFDAKGLVRTLVRTVALQLVRTVALQLVRTVGLTLARTIVHTIPCAHLVRTLVRTIVRTLCAPCAHHCAHHAVCACARNGAANRFPAQGVHKPRLFANDHMCITTYIHAHACIGIQLVQALRKAW